MRPPKNLSGIILFLVKNEGEKRGCKNQEIDKCRNATELLPNVVHGELESYYPIENYPRFYY